MANREAVIEMKIPANPELMSVLRLAVSGVAARMNFPEESIEDIKVAVSEACTNVVQYAYPPKSKQNFIFLKMKQKDKSLEIIIEDKGKGFSVEKPPRRELHDGDIHLGLGITFMRNLMDKVDIKSQKNKGTIVTLLKKLK